MEKKKREKKREKVCGYITELGWVGGALEELADRHKCYFQFLPPLW